MALLNSVIPLSKLLKLRVVLGATRTWNNPIPKDSKYVIFQMEPPLQIFKEWHPLLSALVSQGCHSKVPQIVWLKTIEMCSLTVLEGKSLKLRCDRGHTASKVLKGGSFLASSSSRWLQPFPGVWLHLSSLCLCLDISSLCLCVLSSSYTDTRHWY